MMSVTDKEHEVIEMLHTLTNKCSRFILFYDQWRRHWLITADCESFQSTATASTLHQALKNTTTFIEAKDDKSL